MKLDSFDHYDHRTKGIFACGPELLEALKRRGNDSASTKGKHTL